MTLTHLAEEGCGNIDFFHSTPKPVRILNHNQNLLVFCYIPNRIKTLQKRLVL